MASAGVRVDRPGRGSACARSDRNPDRENGGVAGDRSGLPARKFQRLTTVRSISTTRPVSKSTAVIVSGSEATGIQVQRV